MLHRGGQPQLLHHAIHPILRRLGSLGRHLRLRLAAVRRLRERGGGGTHARLRPQRLRGRLRAAHALGGLLTKDEELDAVRDASLARRERRRLARRRLQE